MKRILLVTLAVLSAGLFDGAASAAEPVSVPTSNLPVTLGQDVSVNQVYIVRRRRYRTVRTVRVNRWGRRIVVYRRVYY